MPICQLDSNGVRAWCLAFLVSGRTYSLIAYSRYLEDDARTDRVIATQWDASFCLFDGIPSPADINHLADEATVRKLADMTRVSSPFPEQTNRLPVPACGRGTGSWSPAR